MMKQLLFSFTLLLLLLFHCSTTLAQSPAKAPAAAAPTLAQSPAPAPAPATPAKAQSPAQVPATAGPADINKILKKSGKFTILIRLLRSSKVNVRINAQLKSSNQGLTIFAPTDSAFSNLKAGILNTLSDSQQVQLVLYHVLPTFLPTSQFQTVSNPLRTQAGDTSKDQFPLYVTTSGNLVNVSTGIVDATVADTIYSDNQLAVYEVDRVLLPMKIFGSTAAAALTQEPTAAPAPEKPEKETPVSTVNSANSDTRHGIMVSIGVAVIAAFSL